MRVPRLHGVGGTDVRERQVDALGAAGERLGAHLWKPGEHPLCGCRQCCSVAGQRSRAFDGCADVVAEVAVVIEDDGVAEDVHRMSAEVG